jgi:hypothetical protein
MECLLIKGSKWPLTELSKRDRIEDLNKALQFGNHKGALQKPELLKKLISNDIKFGYGLVVPRGKIAQLPNACLAPMNIITSSPSTQTVRLWARRGSPTTKVSNGNLVCQLTSG